MTQEVLRTKLIIDELRTKAGSMTGQPERMYDAQEPVAPTADEVLSRIQDRMTDPILTNHDRWVLNQFARFLGSIASEPDRRTRREREARHLP